MRKLFLALSLCLSMGIVWAQTFGAITGEVRDPSGAVTPNAPVTVTDTATNASRSTVTNGVGIYSFPDLPPALYQVRVTAPGFQPMASTVEIQVQQTAKVDFTLQVGQSTQTVEVSAAAAALTTENATVGTVIEERRIEDLPLNGRDYFQLVALSPNVTYGFTAPAQASGREGGLRATITISQTGTRSTWQNYTLDGVTNTDVDFNLYIILPSVDMLQEFKVQSGIYPAEFGREAGQVNVATKSGTNDPHGTAYEFLRNSDLDARPRDFVPPVPAKQPYRQNQYGFTFGGPVYIPRIFSGRNKVFFETNWEGFKSRTGASPLATTLTQAMRNGDFSAVGVPLLNPFSRSSTTNSAGVVTYTATPFPNNQIPVTLFNPGSVFLLKFMPLPNLPGQPGTPQAPLLLNYIYNTSTPVDRAQFNQRVDWNESSKSQWFGRYGWTSESTTTPGLTKDGLTISTGASQWMLANIRVISPSKVNEVRFGRSLINNVIGQQLAGVENVDQEIGVPVSLPTGVLWGVPAIGLANNLTSFGNSTNGPYTINNRYYQGVDNFSWIRGKHSFRFGGEYRHDQFPSFGNEFTRGSFSYTGVYTSDPGSSTVAAGANKAEPGYSGADFLLGATSPEVMAVSAAQTDFSANEWALYVDDTYKLSRKLTLTLGLRWEVAQPLRDDAHNEVTELLRQGLPNYQLCVPNCGNPNVANLALHPLYVRAGSGGNFWQGINFINPDQQVARDGSLGSRLIKTNYRNFAPRVGFAYSPNDKWAIRGGFGIFYSQESKNSIFDLNRNLAGRITTAPNTQIAPVWNYQNIVNATTLPVVIDPSGLTWGVDQHMPTSYTMAYVLNVQRQFGTGTTLEVGYNGNEDRHLDYLNNENQPVPGITPFPLRAPYPELNAIQYLLAQGVGNYNGLGVKLTQRLSGGMTALIGYTWSKALDDASAIRGVSNDFAPENALCRSCEYGPSDYNVPQRLVASILYPLPFGQGQKFVNHGGFANEVIGGWQASTIFTATSGMPIDTTSFDAANVAILPSSNRLNCTGQNPYISFNPKTDQLLNYAAFTNAVAIPNSFASFGNCGRNNLIGPSYWTWDYSMIKNFKITERQRLQLRAEMFNIANHPALGSPSASYGTQTLTPSSTFGIIRSTTGGTMRQIQFALKYIF